jgi:hypothetical protein
MGIVGNEFNLQPIADLLLRRFETAGGNPGLIRFWHLVVRIDWLDASAECKV